MTTQSHEFPEPISGLVPDRPSTLRPIDGSFETYEEAAADRLNSKVAVALGGLSLIGESGYMVGTIGIMSLGSETPEGFHLKGWSLHLGHPEEKYRQLRHFDTEHDEDDVLLPIPNTMTYFAGEVDPALAENNADSQKLVRVAQFILPFMSDDGPPKGIDW